LYEYIARVLLFQYFKARGRWEDNIRMDLREMQWEGMEWINLAQDSDQWRTLMNTLMNLRVP